MIATNVASRSSERSREHQLPAPGPAIAGRRRSTGSASFTSPNGADDRWGVMMVAARDGDDQAYDMLLRELTSWLQRYFRRRLTPSASDDATQEVLLAVHNRRYTYEVKAAFLPWVATIARHKWMDCLRRQYRETELDPDAVFLVEDHGAAIRSRIVLGDLIERLRPAQAEVVRLVKIEGASILEAAAVTGQSPSLVKVNIHRALKKLSGIVAGPDMLVECR